MSRPDDCGVLGRLTLSQRNDGHSSVTVFFLSHQHLDQTTKLPRSAMATTSFPNAGGCGHPCGRLHRLRGGAQPSRGNPCGRTPGSHPAPSPEIPGRCPAARRGLPSPGASFTRSPMRPMIMLRSATHSSVLLNIAMKTDEHFRAGDRPFVWTPVAAHTTQSSPPNRCHSHTRRVSSFCSFGRLSTHSRPHRLQPRCTLKPSCSLVISFPGL